MKKKTFLAALALFLTFGLVACGSDDTDTEVTEPGTEVVVETDGTEEATEELGAEDTEEETVEADGPGHATSAGGITDGDRLAVALSGDSPERAWVAGLAADVEMEGPLYIEGEVERHAAGDWTGTFARKLGFYQRAEIGGVDRVPVGAWSLTVANGIHVNSPGTYFIAEGPFVGEVHGDVYVNVPYFRLSGVRINGDVIFANEHYRDTATAQEWDSSIANIDTDTHEEGEYDGIILYQGNSGFGTISNADPSTNVSNIDFAEMVTGEVRIAE